MDFKELPFHPLATKGSKIDVRTPYFDVGDFQALEVCLEVHSAYAPSDVSTLDTSIEHSADLDTWLTLVSFVGVAPPLLVIPTAQVEHLTGFLRFVRGCIHTDGTEPILYTFSLLGIARKHE